MSSSESPRPVSSRLRRFIWNVGPVLFLGGLAWLFGAGLGIMILAALILLQLPLFLLLRGKRFSSIHDVSKLDGAEYRRRMVPLLLVIAFSLAGVFGFLVYLKNYVLTANDPTRAIAELQEAGWEADRGLFGVMVDSQGENLTPHTLAQLEEIHTVEILKINHPEFNDTSLQQVVSVVDPDTLWFLLLGKTAVSDDGLKLLVRLSDLGFLDLHETSVSDGGLRHLRRLKGLKTLDLSGTRVTPEGIEKLQQALSECTIHFEDQELSADVSEDPTDNSGTD